MLENANDYVSFIVLCVLLFIAVGLLVYFANLRRIEKNLKKEVKYYDYDKRN